MERIGLWRWSVKSKGIDFMLARVFFAVKEFLLEKPHGSIFMFRSSAADELANPFLCKTMAPASHVHVFCRDSDQPSPLTAAVFCECLPVKRFGKDTN